MNYFSQVRISNLQSLAKQLLLKENRTYRIHQLLWTLFSEQRERRFLFREYEDQQGMPCFYLLSTEEPNKHHPALTVRSKPFAPKLHRGMQLAFELRANPVISRHSPDGKVQRHDVMMHAKHQARTQAKSDIDTAMNQAAVDWLCNPRRLEKWGIRMTSTPQVGAYLQHRMQRREQTISLSSVDYQGILEIVDPGRFNAQMLQGFGKGKAFGCGLMLIRPC